MRFGWNPNEASSRLLGVAILAGLAYLAAYTFIYWAEPFSDLWNMILANAFLITAAAGAALMATLIWKRYDPADVPREIWIYFSAGLWLWVVAELTWGYQNVTMGEVPEGISDLFWISAYFFFGYALFVQYRILAQPAPRDSWRLVLILLGLLTLLYVIVLGVFIVGTSAALAFGTAVNAFYPAADFVLALVALWLTRHFIGGAFSWPWFGLLAFSFADLLYAWIEISGLYAWSVDQANALSTITDVVYLSAYLVLGWCILAQWVFLKYGMRSPALR